MVIDREERDDKADTQAEMKVIDASQTDVDTEARWTKKGGKAVFGYKQHMVVDNNGLVIAVETTSANQHDSKFMPLLLDKAGIEPNS